MKDGQTAIYYVLAPTRRLGEGGPHVEALLKRGLEVLYLTDPVDQWVVDSLPEFEGKKLISATAADLELGEEPGDQPDASGVAAHFKRILGDRVADVRASTRLSDSPVCLVTPRGAMASHIERLLRAHDSELPQTKRILEVNPTHPVVVNLGRVLDATPDAPEASGWVEMLYDQALLAEGSPIEDPAAFAKRLSTLLQRATETGAA
jgi:molecular chaperone HtpG